MNSKQIIHFVSEKSSLSDGFQNKEQVNKRWIFEWSLFLAKKILNVKHIESYKTREKYQAEIVLLPNFVWD